MSERNYKHLGRSFMNETEMCTEPWRVADQDLFGLHAEDDEEAARDAEFWRKANRNTIIGVVLFILVLAACGAGVAGVIS